MKQLSLGDLIKKRIEHDIGKLNRKAREDRMRAAIQADILRFEGGLSNVCAWCRSIYDQVTQKPIRKLSDEEYSQVKSHGICGVCSDKVKGRI